MIVLNKFLRLGDQTSINCGELLFKCDLDFQYDYLVNIFSIIIDLKLSIITVALNLCVCDQFKCCCLQMWVNVACVLKQKKD